MADVVRTWFVVDDQLEEVERSALVSGLKARGTVRLDKVSPRDAVNTLFHRSKIPIAGAMVDIDLSAEIAGTGLGLAQDLRARQKNEEIPDYPVVCFANPDPVKKYVGADPVSDDLFDLLVSKICARENPRGRQRVSCYSGSL